MRWFPAAALLSLSALLAAAPVAAYEQSPALDAAVAAGTLPPVDARLPAVPAVAALTEPWQSPGEYGGTLHLLMGRAKDVRMMVVYGYARLVGYTPDLTIKPDILQDVDVEEGRIFTLHLRPGHRWSDGHPFTTEDFRYYWEDVANNEKLSPVGPPPELMVEGEKPTVEVIDETTIRYAWSKPNPDFLPALAGASPLYIYRPAHYLKAYHAAYAEPDRLAARVEEQKQRNWAALHNRMDNMYKNDNPDLPTLQPWVVTTAPPSERYVFERNPYYHRVDPQGRQLPYIDTVVMQIADGKLVAAKTGAGESDLQAREIRFDNFTFLKAAEEREDFAVRQWRTAKGAHLALYPNLNANDPAWRSLNRDARFRRALSLAINRYEINRVIYFGLALEGNNTVMPKSPLYEPRFQELWARFDPREANRLLDEIGLTGRDGRGVRLLPDGRPLEIIVETAGESTEESDVLELIRDSWMDVGIKLYTKPSQREVFRNRIFAGDTIMAISSGVENGLATPDQSPAEFAPTSQQQYQWPKWGQYYETRGGAGEAVDMELPQRLLGLLGDWRHADTTEARTAIWKEMLGIYADQQYSVGIVRGVLQPVVVSNKLKNVPPDGIYNWDPGAHFGLYRPDCFWFTKASS